MANSAHTPRVILVTGGAGFIGCNYVRYLLANDPTVRVINLDALTYAGNVANLEDVAADYGQRYRFVHGDICDAEIVGELFGAEGIDTLVHLAAESHVDRSITGPAVAVHTNVLGTYTLLECALAAWGDRQDVRFHHVSTDEVFGSLDAEGAFTETTPYDPSSPYSASKAASDHFVRAWHRTYGLPVTLSNCSNNYGPYQFPEKLLPLMITNALQHKPLPVYGDGTNVRDWLYVVDHCEAIDLIVRRGEVGRTYNVGGNNEWRNIDVVNLMCDLLEELQPPEPKGRYHDLVTFVSDRPGHDQRYAIDATRIQAELGWEPTHRFEDGLRETIQPGFPGWPLARDHREPF